jgi:hypothetical protein
MDVADGKGEGVALTVEVACGVDVAGNVGKGDGLDVATNRGVREGTTVAASLAAAVGKDRVAEASGAGDGKEVEASASAVAACRGVAATIGVTVAVGIAAGAAAGARNSCTENRSSTTASRIHRAYFRAGRVLVLDIRIPRQTSVLSKDIDRCENLPDGDRASSQHRSNGNPTLHCAVAAPSGEASLASSSASKAPVAGTMTVKTTAMQATDLPD